MRIRTSSGPSGWSGSSTMPIRPRAASSGSRRLPILVTATVLIRLSVARWSVGGGPGRVGDHPTGGRDRRGEAVAVLVAQLLVVAEARVHLGDAEPLEGVEPDAPVGNYVGDAGRQAAVGQVVLEDDEAATGLVGALGDQCLVDRLQGE